MKLEWIANRKITSLLALVIISILAYLPLLGQIGYMNDDWYLMYSAGAYGPDAFTSIFSVDRPARALVMIPAYLLFGENPLYYNLSAYAFRLLSALAFLWTLRMLFPIRHGLALLSSLFFLIYPGFLSQPNGIDYQSHLLALAAAHLSIALTVKAVLTDGFEKKAWWLVSSIVFGLLYLSQMEWYIGFEFFRWGSVFLLASRTGGVFVRKVLRTIRWGYLSLAIPGIFLIWRLFFFQSERGATDMDVQFEQVRLYPIQTLYHWSVQVLRDLYDVTLSAWVTPLVQLTGYIQWWGGILAVVVAGLLFYVLHLNNDHEGREMLSRIFVREALMLGLFIAIGGLIPIAMVNRDVSFPAYSRYSLVSSAGVAILSTALLLMVKPRILRNGLVAFLVTISILTHNANTVKAARQTAATRDFWWQISWRIPQLEKNTTLIASYPGPVLEEDYFIWGPANLIYYPDKQNEKNIQPGVFAVLLKPDTVEKVLARERQVYDKRKNIITYANFRNILVLTQPGVNSCVHVVDGMRPEFSVGEWDFIQEVGPFSEIEHVLTDESPHTPPMVVFGPEPDHGWCYYYQKADLARQRGDWEQVLEIGRQALGRGLAPKDPIEWIPFLQAYAIDGDVERLAELSPVMNTNLFVAQQTCQILGGMSGLPDPALEAINSLYCSN